MESRNYFNMYSYIHVIMDLLGKTEGLENFVIAEIFNEKIRNMDDGDIGYMSRYSGLFENRLLNMSENERMELAKTLYYTYIAQMVINFSNGNIETAYILYDSLENRVKEVSGTYGNCIHEFYESNIKKR